MAKYTVVEENVESGSERRVRIFLVVMFFIQVVISSIFPLMHGTIEGQGIAALTAVNLLIQRNGYNSFAEWVMAFYGALLIVLPIVSFFFCLLDKRSKKKYIITGLTSVICAVVICFGPKDSIAIGGVVILIINIITLFMTSQGYQATRMRELNSPK